MVDGRVDGLVILSPLVSEEVLEALDQREFPYVTIAAGKNRSASDYSIDNARGIELAVRHLVELGHTKIGFISGLWEHSDAVEREKAFKQSIRSFELPLPEHWVRPGDFTMGGGERAAREILTLPTRPTALVCANDESAWGAVTTAKKLGLDIPREVSVTGFDDLPLSSRMDPPLSTVRQPLETMVQGAVAGLLALIEGRSAPSRQFEPALIARGSTSRPPEDIHP
jgi:DNA-binding LacI/PurR family transcriptional regulator